MEGTKEPQTTDYIVQRLHHYNITFVYYSYIGM